MSGTVTAWLNLLRDGDDAATEKIWNYFFPSLQTKIASSCRGLRICDEEDIAITAFYRLVEVMQKEDRYSVTDREEFWRLLLIISKNAVNDWRKYDSATCRGGKVNEVPLDQVSIPINDHRKTTDRNESSLLSQFAEMAERMQRPEFIELIQLKQSGLNNQKIAARMGLSLRTIQYIIRDIKIAWYATFDQDLGSAAA